jgi:twinkle protein
MSEEKTIPVESSTMPDCLDDMLHDLKNGKEKGTTTYIQKLDEAWTWRQSEFNIWTGYSNEGKSQFLRFISLIKGLEEPDYKFAFYAPEDYPAKEFFDDLIHTMSGHSTDKSNPNFIGEKLYMDAYHRIKDIFYFMYIRPPKNSFVNVLKSFIPLIEEKGVKACVVDPLIKVARPSKYLNADDKYAMYITTLATDFARKFNVSLHLVMHQLTARTQENGLYAKPSMYSIKGGGTWADGTDNILSTWRPNYARDKEDTEVIISSAKIKKQKLVGIPQDVQMRFNRKTNRYVDYHTSKDLYNFDSKIHIPRIKLLF